MTFRKKRPAPRGVLGLLTDGLLLFLCLLSVTFSLLTAYGVEAVEPVLVWAAALLSLLTLILVSLPKYKLPLTLLALCAWAWGVWKLWEPLVWGGARLQCDITNTIAAKVPGVSLIVPVTQLPPELWPWVTTLWLVMVGALYALILSFLLCRVGAALPILLWTLLPILPALCVTEAPAFLPTAGLLLVWLTLLLTSLAEKRDRRGAARLRPAALGVSLLTLTLLAQSLPREGKAQPLWASDLREEVISGVSRMDLSALMSRWSGFWTGSGSTEYVNLTGGGPSRTGRVALRLECGQPGKYYLRGHSAEVYTGRRWEPLDREAREELEAIRDTGIEPLLLLGEGASQVTGYRYDILEDRPVEVRTPSTLMKVENVAAPGGCVYYPYALAYLPEGADFAGDSYLERTGEGWIHEIPFYPKWESATGYRGRYYAYYFPEDARPQAQTEDGAYRDFVYAHDLQVPQSLLPVLQDWLREATEPMLGYPVTSLEECVRYSKAYAQWEERRWQEWVLSSKIPEEESVYGWEWGTPYSVGRIRGSDVILSYSADSSMLYGDWTNGADGPTQEEIDAVTVTQEELEDYRDIYRSLMLDVIVNRLAQTTHYDRNTPAPPAGEDYVDWFLNHAQQGYCMHYATSAVLLLRAAGIPARYVSGYVADVPHSGKTEVTDYGAHAWVEYYIDGVGWVPQEATPGYEGNAMGDAMGDVSVPSAAPTASANAETPTPTPGANAAEDGPGKGEKGGTGIFPSAMNHFLTALLGLLCVLLGRFGVLKKRRSRMENEADRNTAVLWIYHYYQRLKPWGATESQELTALAEKARFSQHTLTAAEHAQAVTLFAAEQERVKALLPQWRRLFFLLAWGKT